MKISIEKYEPLHDRLKFMNKKGEAKPFVYIARIGVVAKICSSERIAGDWLEKHGYELKFNSKDQLEWVLSRKSEFELDIEENYKKCGLQYFDDILAAAKLWIESDNNEDYSVAVNKMKKVLKSIES